MNGKYTLIGADYSYYTGKVEAYLKAKGIAYDFPPLTFEKLQETSSHTGVMQIPQLQMPDGSWLTDSSLIIRHFERTIATPRIMPEDPAIAFVSLILEDFADEWLWRPAMYYRWSFEESAELLSGWLAELSPEDGSSFSEKKTFWLTRQKQTFVDGDGVTDYNRSAVEASYMSILDLMQTSLENRDFLMGSRPTEADFGFFASMFRHFFSDPTPGRIMRARAPAVVAWCGRMWNLSPERVDSGSVSESIPGDLDGILDFVCSVYFPYLAANEHAVLARDDTVRYTVQDVEWVEPTKPYRVWCLDQLREKWAALTINQQETAGSRLDAQAIGLLSSSNHGVVTNPLEDMPFPPDTSQQLIDSWWRTTT